MRRWVLAFADDLTGALETSSKFASQGVDTIITTERTLLEKPAVPVLVIDTETRHLSKYNAGEVVRKIAAQARHLSPWLLYKKTDSTLRGHIAAEFEALLHVFPDRKLVYAPAYPDMGRTVRNGRLYVHGIPVHETAFASDSLNPVLESDIAILLAGVAATVHHGESNDDVNAAALQILNGDPPSIAAGPAALAGALAENLPFSRRAPVAFPVFSRVLVINGSQHPVSQAQIAGYNFDENWRYFTPATSAGGEERAMQTGEQVQAFLKSNPIQALVIFGGDTAFGIHRALGSHPFRAVGEILPGVPIARSGDFFWITKAGGFGAPDILCDIRKRLT